MSIKATIENSDKENFKFTSLNQNNSIIYSMNEPKWIETEKECEITEGGELIPKKVMLELERGKENPWKYNPKEVIDLSVRIIALFAIITPIYLFYKGQEAERNKQNALFQLDVYSSAATELHSMMDKKFGSKEFDESQTKLLYEIYPKLILLNDKPIIDTFTVIKDILAFYSIVANNVEDVDTTYTHLYSADAEDKVAELKASIDNARVTISDWGSKSKRSKSLLSEERELYLQIVDSLDTAIKIIESPHTFLDGSQNTIVLTPKQNLVLHMNQLQLFVPALVNEKLKYFLEDYVDRLDSMMIESLTKSLQPL